MSDKRYAYILLSDEKWWNRLCERNRSGSETHAFVRRNRVGPLETQKLLFYVKRPIMQIRGVADFVERLAGDYKELWNTYGGETCLKTFNEYVAFLQGRKTATFIRFANFRELQTPVSMEAINTVLGVPRMPRGGKYLNREIVNQLTV
ncbi:MAG: hypothetical protein QMD23_00500 [Candidatus Bathyarchaeia archaeon]|nr:hypothetical protein [Candidatus Bathyarchaeia archaeon]